MIPAYVQQRIKDEAFGESPRTVGENQRAVSRYAQQRLARKVSQAEMPHHSQVQNQNKPSILPRYKPTSRA